MDHLWTPWRSTYLTSNKDKQSCIFCEAASRSPDESGLTNSEKDAHHLVIARGTHCFAILNRYPYTNGHLMIVPYEHVADLNGMTPEAAIEMMSFARRAELVLNTVYNPDGLNLGMNVGSAAGAGIAQHVHLHILPRWFGDANFLTTVGETRVIPEILESTFDKLRGAFAALP